MKLRILLMALIAIPVLTGCETEEDRVMADAQSCLNHANPGNVDACVAKVNGYTSQQSFLIRCTADYIAQGITAATLVTAFQNIKQSMSSTPNVPSTTYAMSYLLFNDTILNHTTDQTLSDCGKAGATALQNLAKLSKLAYAFSNVTPADIQNPAALAADIRNYAGPTNVIGDIAIDLKESYCDNGNFNGTDICNKVNSAYNAAAGDPTLIGAFIKTYLDDI